MDTIAIFGAGPQGRTAAAIYQKKGYDVKYFIDNDKKKQGTSIFDIPVLSIEGYYNGTLVKTITRDFYNESGGCCRCFQ